jgi:hypothetical protein
MQEHDNMDNENKYPGQKGSDPFQPQGPRDGLDNTGTQGKDSLKDDGYTGSAEKPSTKGNEDGTGSSSEDFTNRPADHIDEKKEDRALEKGI